MTEWTDQEQQEVVNEIMRRSGTDAAFREKCLSDAHAAISEVAGKDVPAGVEVRFVSNEGADLTLVLPDPVAAGGELTDDMLENVSGGFLDRGRREECSQGSRVEF